jgi:hypothetical protein
MPATTVGINEGSYQRLLHLVEQTGRPAGAILEQALADYECKVSGGANPGNVPLRPAADEEAELLEDAGRVRTRPRDGRLVVAHVVPVPRRAPRLGAGGEE